MEDESFDIIEKADGTLMVLHVIYEVETMGGNDIETFYDFDSKNSARLRELLVEKRGKDIKKSFHASFSDVYAFMDFCDRNKLKYSISKRY